jgi:glycosyltransferase involved in cell wall biosynthesis
MLMKRLLKFKLVYTIFDFYANNIQEGPLPTVRKVLKKIVKAMDFRGINRCDLLILVDESRLEEIRGARVKKIIFIYNTPEDFEMLSGSHERKKNEKVIIFFAGLLMGFRGITDMAKAALNVPGVKLVLAGQLIDSGIREYLDLHPGSIQYLGWIPSYREVLKMTMSADILFRFSDPKHPKTRYESPNKLFEAMMCAKPIIVSDESAMATIVRNTECGLVVPYGDEEAIRKAVTALATCPDLRDRLGRNGRNAYNHHYSWSIMEQRLVTAYNQI